MPGSTRSRRRGCVPTARRGPRRPFRTPRVRDRRPAPRRRPPRRPAAPARTGVQQRARGGLRGLHVGLVEGVDAQHAPGDGGGVLPHDELRGERPADEDLALVVLAEVELVGFVDDAHDLQVRGAAVQLGRDGEKDDRQDAGAGLARGLGDQLFDPVRQPVDVRPVADEPRACRAGHSAAGDRRQRGRARGCPGCRWRPRGASRRPRRGARRRRRRQGPPERGRTRSAPSTARRQSGRR